MNEVLGRNGGLMQALNLANTMSAMRSPSAMDRLSNIVSKVMWLFL